MSEDTALMDPETTGDAAPRVWWLAAALAVVSATVFRLAMNFSHSYPPGVDAAYYPLQTRAWLVRGHLMHDDLPLYFWINAAFSKVLTIFGMSLNEAVLFSSRALDSFLEPWVAAGVLGLGYVWSEGRRKALLGCTAAAVLAVLSPPVIRMLSDFEKNSLGFVLLCAAVWACRSAMIRHTARAWLCLAAILALSAMTHLGAFAMTLTIVVIAVLLWSISSMKSFRERVITGAIFAAGAALLIALLALFDPGRIARLLRAPAHLFRIRDLCVLPIPLLVAAVVFIGIAMGLLAARPANASARRHPLNPFIRGLSIPALSISLYRARIFLNWVDWRRESATCGPQRIVTMTTGRDTPKKPRTCDPMK